jgi:2-oxoglutarate dehydrogenase E2 component (dihydrolipoamide succinyltransferase)
MSIELKVPAVGESITEVEIGDWLVKEGQSISKDQPVVIIETEKATVELPAPASGILQKISKPTGSVAQVGEVIGQITASDAAPTSAPAKTATEPGVSKPSPEAKAAPASPTKVMPAAARVLAEGGVSAESVQSSGPGGRILKEDAIKAVAAKSPAQPATAPSSGASAPSNPAAPAQMGKAGESHRKTETVRMSKLRRTVAERLVRAQAEAALLTTFNEIDMSAVMTLRKEHGETFLKKYGVKLGFMSFFVKAVVDGLKMVPQMNAEISGTDMIYHRYYDIGVAIGGGKGLVVPILRNAELMSFSEVELKIAEYANKAKDGKLTLQELEGGTFTISNGGVYGSLLSTPIVNPPQSGVLGMHSIQERPVAVQGAVVIRPMMYVALTYDHRIVDGREAVIFLKRIKDVIENPARMLIEA